MAAPEMTTEAHVQGLVDTLRRFHEEDVERLQGWADEAAARGDFERQRFFLDRIAQEEAKQPKPWLPGQPAAA